VRGLTKFKIKYSTKCKYLGVTNKIIRITTIGRKNDRQQQNLSVEIIDKEQM